MVDPSTPGKELSSRDDVLLERLLDDLQYATVSLAISLKGCKRSADNMVLRLSAEQQFESALSHVAPLLALGPVVHDEAVARRLADTMAPFLDLVAQMHWMPAGARLSKLFQDAANLSFGEQTVKVEGRPCAAFQALLVTRATIPVVAAAAPVAAPTTASTSATSTTSTAAAGQPAEQVQRQPSVADVVYEAVFTQGEGQASHDALVGKMYIAFLVHCRGLTEDAARQGVSPTALLGFARSIDNALVGYEGVVAFRIVRNDAACGAQLLRLAPRPPERAR